MAQVTDFLTLERNDPRVEELLLGTFSKSLRALPVASFRSAEVARGEGALDQWTFEVVDVATLGAPPFWRALLAAVRWQLLPLTLSPLLSTFLLLAVFGDNLSPLKMLSAAFGVIALHASVFLLNDGADHLRGLEAPVIQRGWMTANDSIQWGRRFLVAGMVIGLPSVLLSTGGLYLIAAFGPIAILGFNHRRYGLKYWGVGDTLIFLAFGPLLTAGAALASAGHIPLAIWHSGVLWGWLTVTIFHLRNFEKLFVDSLQRSGTFLARLGFDRAKKFLFFQLAALGLVWMSWALELRHSWLWIPTVIYTGGVLWIHGQRLSRIISPLSSLRLRLAQDLMVRLLLAPFILVGLTWFDRLLP